MTISSVQFSRSVMSDSLWPHESQHTRPPCPSPTPGVHSDSHPSSHPATQPSHPLSSPSPPAPKSLPASESLPMSQLFTWGDTGVSALASFLPKNTQGWSPLEWTGWTSLQSKGLSRVLSNTTVQKHQLFGTQLSSQSNPAIPLLGIHLEKTIIPKDTCTPTFIAAPFPITGQESNLNVHQQRSGMEYLSTIKRTGICHFQRYQ